MIGNLKTTIRRNDVDAVLLQIDRLRDRYDRHRRPSRDDLRQPAFPVRVEMDDDDEACTGVGRYPLEEALQSLDATGRSPDRDQREMRGCSFHGRVLTEHSFSPGI